VKNKRKRTLSRRALSEGELRAVCDGASGELRTMLALGIFCGMRLHDAATLDWRACDLDRQRVTFTPHKTAATTGKVIVLPMHPVLRTILAETPPAARRGPVLPETCALYDTNPQAVSKAIVRHFAAAGVRVTSEHKTTRKAANLAGFHALRHSFVSMAAAAGIPLPVVQEIVGHGSPEVQRAYLHMGEAETTRAVLAVPDVFAPAALPAPQTAENGAPTRAEALAAIRARLAADDVPAALRDELTDLLRYT
jgi:integrase